MVRRLGWAPLREYLLALAIVAVTTGVCELIRNVAGFIDIAMIYLACLLFIASRFPRGPTYLAGIATFIAADFFYVPPYYAVTMTDIRYGLPLLVVFLTAIFVSSLTLRIRQQAEDARERERRTAALYAVSQSLAARSSVPELAIAIAEHAGILFDAEAAALIPGSPVRQESHAWTSGTLKAVADYALQTGQAAGRGTEVLPDAEGLCIPLKGAERILGVLGLAGRTPDWNLSPGQWQLLELMASQCSLALERALYAAETEKARITAERERLRSALLSAISHDLRTPLGAVTGASTSLLEQGDKFDVASRRELLETIRDEAIRLNRFVSDLLDMTRIGTGAFTVKKVWYPVEDLIVSALKRLESRLAGRSVQIRAADSLLLAPLDEVLMTQVIINLVENAVKYTPPASPIEIGAEVRDGQVVLQVADRGPGIPPGEEEKVFGMFHRIQRPGDPGGSGVGLTVCQAIVQAHGGTIRMSNRQGGGAVFSVTLPLEGGPPPPQVPEEQE